MVRSSVRIVAISVLVLVVLVGCGSSGDDDPSGTSSSSDGKRIEIALLDTMTFDPSSITASPSENVTVVLTNKGKLPHNFSIEGLNVSVDVGPGETQTTTFTAPPTPGEHKIFCNVPGHEGAGMVGSFTVQE